MQTQIQVYTLGKFTIERSGQVLENFLSVKTALLFLYLAMHPGEHAREKLAALLWSETNDEQSLKNLRTVLSSLRQQLDDILVVTRKSLAIRDDVTIWVDASVFESACKAGFSLPGTLDPLRQMQDIAALYQGDFLASVRVRDADDLDGWISANQYRLRQLHVQLLYDIVKNALEQAKYPLGLQYALMLTNLDPLWEAARRQLMTLLAYTDRASDALQQYDQLARLLDDELGASPDGDTSVLYEQIKSGALTAPAKTVRSTLAAPDTLFVEPVDDVEFAQRMLNSPQCRLLTIYGISGIGKTALASQIGFHRQHLYANGAHFVSLSQVQSASNLPSVIARAIGLELAASTNNETLQDVIVEYFKNRELLLVLDNYEHLLPDTAFVEQLLDESPRLQIIVASQDPLNLYREWLLPLKGLRVPESTAEQPESYEAVRLFDMTARRVNPRFNLLDAIAGVVRICQLVDGLPLGIILAAGWTQVFPVSKIAQHIAEGMEFDLSYQRTLPARHQSIEVMLEYTWNTLDAAQQNALTNLSMFNGEFSLDAFSHLCDAGIDTLVALVQKSLILKSDESYRMHQLVCRYARKRLFYSPDRDTLGQAYLGYYSQLLVQFQRRALPVHEYVVTIETEYANLWNFGWMPRWFQPLYILSMSRFLIVYWEIHQGDELKQVLSLFETIRREESAALESHWRALLHLQLARLYAQTQQVESGFHNLLTALQHACAGVAWHDQCLMFQLYSQMSEIATSASLPLLPRTEEDAILQAAIRALAQMYLDMRDYELADSLLQQLLSQNVSPIYAALVLAARGAIAAEKGVVADACRLYDEALLQIESTDHEFLKLLLLGSLMRLSFSLSRPRDTYRHLEVAVMLARYLESTPALLNLLEFSLELPLVAQNAALRPAMETALARLRDGNTSGPPLPAAPVQTAVEQLLATLSSA